MRHTITDCPATLRAFLIAQQLVRRRMGHTPRRCYMSHTDLAGVISAATFWSHGRLARGPDGSPCWSVRGTVLVPV